ncbi:D-2-hydroxyacid dehydrogenase [Eubacteriales bacterium OttesenSCG-928-N14]|nr:D-2-hydroxyacid dehydrogenase [Eubacteriales bacterium OttesenSCG-928-N14]
MGKSVLVILPLNEEEKQKFVEVQPNYIYDFHQSLTTVDKQMVQRANIIIGNPSKERIKGSQNIEFLQLSSAGSESYVADGILRKEALLANCTGAYGEGIGEYMLCMLCALYRNLHLYRDNQNQHLWQSAGPSKLIRGSIVLVLGTGDIGGSFAKKVHDLGAYIIGVRRTNGNKLGYLDEQYTYDALDELLPKADVVAMALPSTPQTRFIMNRKRLETLKRDAIIINVGRGDAIDLDALHDLLLEKRIYAAGLDVFYPEPLPKDSPLWDLKNLLITPHNNGGQPPQTHERVVQICLKNYKDYVAQREVDTRVDRETGYRVSRV